MAIVSQINIPLMELLVCCASDHGRGFWIGQKWMTSLPFLSWLVVNLSARNPYWLLRLSEKLGISKSYGPSIIIVPIKTLGHPYSWHEPISHMQKHSISIPCNGGWSWQVFDKPLWAWRMEPSKKKSVWPSIGVNHICWEVQPSMPKKAKAWVSVGHLVIDRFEHSLDPPKYWISERKNSANAGSKAGKQDGKLLMQNLMQDLICSGVRT